MPRSDTVRFILGIHNHQPVGNFPEVFERAMQRAYEPILAALLKHPSVAMAVHYSGCLLEWIEENRPAHIESLRVLAARGQIEILSGGFYEPILPLIPPDDRVGQIRLLTRYIEERFGQKARGMWLAERVWEPALASDLHRSGIAYTLLDDYHFLSALDEDPVGGYYLTEEGGRGLALFPISESLRYLIPFREPEETIRFLFERRGRGEVVVMVDDGEKFGLWPDTFAWVREGGWLERFFTALESAQNEGWLKTTTFAEAAASLPSRGRIYLPPNSYFEMTEWSLPPERRRRFEEAAKKMRDKGEWEPMRPFMKGGFFRSFMARYPEARRSVARGRVMSGRLEALDGEAARQGRPSPARRHLWRAQCNCGYWHGLFGGLYLPHIRRGIQDSLALAGAALWDQSPDPTGLRVQSLRVDDLDAHDVLVETASMSLLIEPASGGAISACDFTRLPLPLGATLTRRHEAYHDEAREASREASSPETTAEGSGINIHERRPSAPPDVMRHLVADPGERQILLERFLPEGVTPSDLLEGSAGDLSLGVRRCEAGVRRAGGEATILLPRAVTLRDPESAGEEIAFDLSKEIRVRRGRDGWSASWRAGRAGGGSLAASRAVLFAVELNLALVESASLIVLPESARSLTVSEPWAEEGVSRALVEESYRGFSLALGLAPAGSLWHHPVRTVSRSETGFELIYQGSAVLLVWPLSALADGVTVEFDLSGPAPAAAGSASGVVR